jgi:hypothetical protein
MKSAAECVTHALELEDAASKTNSNTSRKMLLEAAARWRRLAEEATEDESLRSFLAETDRTEFRIDARWGSSKDLVPTTYMFDSATEAITHYRKIVKAGMVVVSIEARDERLSSRISVHKLKAISDAERLLSRHRT